jgi:hypothetical protein
MAWELLAMWAIVTATVVWFIRDERRLRAEADLKRAASYYAHAPKYRHISVEVEPEAVPQPRKGGLSHAQRTFITGFSASRTKA